MFTKLIAVVLGCGVLLSVHAEAQHTAAVIYIKKYEQQKNLEIKIVEEGYSHLQALVKEKQSTANDKNIVALTMLLLKADPSQYAAEVAHSYYLKNKKSIQVILATLKKEDAAHFEQAMKNYQLLLEKGDG